MHMGAHNGGITHAGRLHKVLAAVRNQRTADKNQRTQVVPQAGFADGIRHVNFGFRRDFFTGGTQGDL